MGWCVRGERGSVCAEYSWERCFFTSTVKITLKWEFYLRIVNKHIQKEPHHTKQVINCVWGGVVFVLSHRARRRGEKGRSCRTPTQVDNPKICVMCLSERKPSARERIQLSFNLRWRCVAQHLVVFEAAGCASNVKPPTHSAFHVT